MRKAEPEYNSLEAFVQFLRDDDREHFGAEDLQKLNRKLRVSIPQLCRMLGERGLMLAPRPHVRRFRTYGDNPHDRWQAYRV